MATGAVPDGGSGAGDAGTDGATTAGGAMVCTPTGPLAPAGIQNTQSCGAAGHAGSGCHPGSGPQPSGGIGQPGGELKRRSCVISVPVRPPHRQDQTATPSSAAADGRLDRRIGNDLQLRRLRAICSQCSGQRPVGCRVTRVNSSTTRQFIRRDLAGKQPRTGLRNRTRSAGRHRHASQRFEEPARSTAR